MNRFCAGKNSGKPDLWQSTAIFTAFPFSQYRLDGLQPNISTYFKHPGWVRWLIYTTIEGFNRQLRKVTKVESVFPTDDSLFKLLYLAMWILRKSGPKGGRIRAGFMHSWPSIFREGLCLHS